MTRHFLTLIVLAISCGLFAAGGYADEPTAATPAPAPAPTQLHMRAPPDSLMFTNDELTEIQSRTAGSGSSDSGPDKQPIEDATLYLSTILYYGPKDWTIWVNGVPIGPSQDFQAFQVTEINADSVELLVPLSAQGMRPVRLQPNQTFIAKSGAVVEGKYP